MTKLIAIIFSILIAILPLNFRCEKGYVSYLKYNEQYDSFDCGVTTDDGQEWFLEDQILPRFDDVLVIFDTKGTKELEDDEIKTVISFSSTDSKYRLANLEKAISKEG